MNDVHVEEEEELSSFQKSLAMMIVIATLTLGISVLVGWRLGSVWMITVYPGLPAITYNTSVLLLLSSLALGSLIFNWKLLSTVLCVITILFAGAFVVQNVFEVNFGIDNLLFNPKSVFKEGFTNHVSIYTASSFVLIGLCILTVMYRELTLPHVWMPGLLISTIIGICLTGLYGYGEALNPNQIIYISAYTIMGLILLGIGILLFATSLVKHTYSKAVQIWVSVLITIGVLTISTLFYISFLYEQRESMRNEIFYEGGEIYRFVYERLSTAVHTINRSQIRYTVGISKFDQLWDADVDSFSETLVGFEGMLLIEDKQDLIKMSGGNRTLLQESLPLVLAGLSYSKSNYFTVRTPAGKQMFVIQYPLFKNKTVVALFGVVDLIQVPHSIEALRRFDLLIMFDGALLCNTFMHNIFDPNKNYEHLNFNTTLAGEDFLAYLWPQTTYENSYRGLLPIMLLICGSLLAGFLGFLFYLIQKFKGVGEKLNVANQAKTMFLGNVSHEVRTPLHGIIGTASLLKKTDLQPKQLRYVEIISASGQHLLNLINNLLDMTKMELDSFNFTTQPCNIENICKETLQIVTTSAKEKDLDIEFKFRQAPNINEVNASAQALRQILINLLGNAIKFTDKGRIILDVDVTEESAGDFINIIVADSGAGIPKERFKDVFTKFAQLDSKLSVERGGTGLGLFLTKSLVDKLHGIITFESDLGVGTKFMVRIPVEKYNGEQWHYKIQ